MKLNDLIGALNLTVLSKGAEPEREITGGYTSDLLSDVMGNIDEGMVWITLQVHRNTIAVASLKEVAAVILISGVKPDEDTLAQAESEGVCILSTDMPAFEASGRIYELLK
jgi:DRTGG domain.